MIHTLTKNVHCNKFASNERFYTANSPQFTAMVRRIDR